MKPSRPYPPRPRSHGSPGIRARERLRDPLYADDRNFYKVEKWTGDGIAVEQLLYAGNSLATAQDNFAQTIKHRPRIRLTIRQRTRVLEQNLI